MWIMSRTPGRVRKGGALSTLAEAFSNALCACIIAYCVVSFFAGQAGLLAYRDLRASIARMEKRVADLSAENARLVDLRQGLASDPDKLVREARDIGYLRPGEKMVVFSGLSGAGQESEPAETELLRAGMSTGLPDRLIKILSAMTGAAVLLASLFMGAVQRRSRLVRTANQA
jgi:cell division protein FtsB